METLDAIKTRRSAREFTDKKVSKETIEQILEAGRWAPSGMNNQPWRFIVVSDKKTKEHLAKQTHYEDIINFASCAITVFYDIDFGIRPYKGRSFHRRMRTEHASCVTLSWLGACWLGEILKNKDKVAQLFEAPASYELMAVIALGESAEKSRKGERKGMDELVYKWI